MNRLLHFSRRREGKCDRHEKYPAEPADAEVLRRLILQDAEHQSVIWPEVANELGMEVARSTIERLVHEYLDIHRYIARLKPPLHDLANGFRLDFVYWAIRKLDIFVTYMWVIIEIGDLFLCLPMGHGLLLVVSYADGRFLGHETLIHTTMLTQKKRKKSGLCFGDV